MMQQLATSSSKVADSALPFDMSKDSQDVIQSFESKRSAFEQAFDSAQNGAFRQAFDNDVIREKPVYTDKVDESVSAFTASDAKANRKAQALSQNKEQEGNALVHRGDADKSANAASTETKETANLKNAVDGEPQNTIISEGEDTPRIPMSFKEQLLSNPDPKEGFDYVTFVSDLQALTKDANGTVINDDLSTAVNTLTESTELNGLNTQSEDKQGFINISLSKDDLQNILDAQASGLDLDMPLSDEQLAKLSETIQKMLSQYKEQISDAQNKTEIVPEMNADFDASDSELDAELLAIMLQKNIKTDENIVGAAQNLEALSNADARNQNAKMLNDTDQVLEATALEKTLAEDEEASLLKSLASDLQASLGANSQINALETTGIAAKEEAKLLVSLKTQNADNQTNESDMSILNQLSSLDERSQTNILENIKARVEKFAAELGSSPAKGSEFVAAMQAGLKEIKEQLQSGREPGIDLKAMVSEALSQVSVEIPPQQQSKFDSALTQFAGILNLANSVNQSTSAQAQQIFGVTETLIAKENNLLHAEGTKLAQQAPTAFDKAVNIFKPDGQQQLADKVRWMVNTRNPAAEIRLDPPELGAMQIKVNMNGDAASVSFTVQSAQAKDVLDQAAPRLRDMLQESGIELGQSSVQQESRGQQQNEQSLADKGSSSNSNAASLANEQNTDAQSNQSVIEQRVTNGALGGIDFYA
uniref:flagellar hook-length control protein FliK n=1 Tax=Ningiella ruwaisensis TaxID=2364274 RepID=UPI0010A01FD5|nr:flagellar hook-length control protein FliK [Ningiella ruwaisensis]